MDKSLFFKKMYGNGCALVAFPVSSDVAVRVRVPSVGAISVLKRLPITVRHRDFEFKKEIPV